MITPPLDVGGHAQPGAGVPAVCTRGRPAWLVARSLFLLTKPRIIELLLVTTLPAMFLAARGMPSPGLIAVTLAGGALAAGSANTLNCYLDRDIDAVMRRTSRRPLVRPLDGYVSGADRSGGGEAAGVQSRTPIRPGEALAWGVVLSAAATVLLGVGVNWLAAGLADGGTVIYVFVYTMVLKRRTSANIVIGGSAGCFPVLVGWAAVTGTLGWPAWVLFAVIFFWTPPHFWALAIKFRDDYAAAKVPMLPVVAGPAVVARKIVIYSWAMVTATLALIPAAGWEYGACAAVLGGWFLAAAHRLRAQVAAGAQAVPMRLFHLSVAYLTLLSAAVVIAALLPGTW